MAQERGAGETAPHRQRPGRADRPVRATGGLAAAAANEYAYVTRDLKRFLALAGALFVALFVIWGVAIAGGFISF